MAERYEVRGSTRALDVELSADGTWAYTESKHGRMVGAGAGLGRAAVNEAIEGMRLDFPSLRRVH